MLQDGLSYPTQGDSWIGRFVIGSVLLFFSFLALPLLPYYGYLVRILAGTAQGEDTPPDFEDWGKLTVDGFKAFVISFAYGLVPNIIGFGLLFLLFGVIGVAGSAGGDAGGLIAGVGLVTVLVGAVVLMLVQLVVLYLLPAALINFAAEDSIGAAFDVGSIKELVLSSEYLIAMLAPLGISFVVGIVAQILAFTVVGLVLLPPLYFWMGVAIFRMFGLAYREVKGTVGVAEATPGATTA